MKIIDNVYLYSPSQGFQRDKIHHLKIENGEIKEVATGRYDGSGETVINGQQKVLTPSFTDSHLHLLRYGLMKTGLDLRMASSWNEVKQTIGDDQAKKKLKQGDWIVARGLMDNTYDDLSGLATSKNLDEMEYERPMFILHKDGHECVVNTPALQEIKKDDQLHEGHSPFIRKDDDGNWIGRFTDTAVHYIKFNFRNKNENEIDKALRAALPHLAQYGITSVHPDDLNYAGTYNKVWNGYRDLEDKGLLSVRAFLHHYVFNTDDMHTFLENWDWRTGDGTDKVRVGAFKIFVDGTHRLHTAALQEPYHDAPEDRGTLIYNQNELNTMLQLAEENNMQVAMHCIGDRAVKTAINAIEETDNTMRHRIIHAQTVSDSLIKKLQNLQPPVETQPGFLLDEWNRYAGWVGEKRGKFCGMGKTFSDAGVPFTLSSDAPIGPINPFEHIYASVNRTSFAGHPKDGWMPEEKLDINEAFKRYTTTPAYLEFMEDQKGTISEGAKADFMLLADFPDQYPSDDLYNINVHETWMDGEKVFDQAEDKDVEFT